MMIRRVLAVATVVAAFGGCAASERYQAVRSLGEAKARCERELTVAAQRTCEEQYRMDYEEYLKQRDEAVSPRESTKAD